MLLIKPLVSIVAVTTALQMFNKAGHLFEASKK